MTAERERRRRLSRAEIESLCLLRVIGEGACSMADVATRLSLSPALARYVASALHPLCLSGFVVVVDERVSITEAGARWARERLLDLEA